MDLRERRLDDGRVFPQRFLETGSAVIFRGRRRGTGVALRAAGISRGSGQDGLSHRIFTARIAGSNPAYPAKVRVRNIDGDVRGSYPRKWRSSRHGPTNIQGWQKGNAHDC